MSEEEKRTSPVFERACGLIANPYFWESRHSSQLHITHNQLTDLLYMDDIGYARVPSNTLYARIFDADVSTVASIGKMEPGTGEFDMIHRHSMYRMYLDRYQRSTARNDITQGLLILPLLISAVFVQTRFATHLKIAAGASLVVLPFTRPWDGFVWLTQILAPLVYLHRVFQSPVDSLGQVIIAALLGIPFAHIRTVIRHLIPWYIAGAGSFGFYARLILPHLQIFPGTSPIACVGHIHYNLTSCIFIPLVGLSEKQRMIANAICIGLMAPLAIGFIFDVPKHISVSMKRNVPGFAPQLCTRIASGIKWWNSRVRRLGPLWAMFAGNLIWTSKSTQEERENLQLSDSSLFFDYPSRQGTWIFALTSTIIGAGFGFLGQWIQQSRE
jgi:hypothetical protein